MQINLPLQLLGKKLLVALLSVKNSFTLKPVLVTKCTLSYATFTLISVHAVERSVMNFSFGMPTKLARGTTDAATH